MSLDSHLDIHNFKSTVFNATWVSIHLFPDITSTCRSWTQKKAYQDLEFVLHCLVSSLDHGGKVQYGDVAKHFDIQRKGASNKLQRIRPHFGLTDNQRKEKIWQRSEGWFRKGRREDESEDWEEARNSAKEPKEDEDEIQPKKEPKKDEDDEADDGGFGHYGDDCEVWAKRHLWIA